MADFARIGEEEIAGAEARVDFEAFTARLKSCPVTKPSFFAVCKVVRWRNPRRASAPQFWDVSFCKLLITN
jgi:hypothetical protein